ncbi:hypothetical protein HDU90_001621 [Geranomyces variabilis]|nr:hypothetical protein HDU90_001621 [Geranomyces variabilis]
MHSSSLRNRESVNHQRSKPQYFSKRPQPQDELGAAQKSNPGKKQVTRPDIAIRENRNSFSEALADVMNYGGTLPALNVDNLLRDMNAFSAPSGGVYVASATHISDCNISGCTIVYAEKNSIKLAGDGSNALNEMKNALDAFRNVRFSRGSDDESSAQVPHLSGAGPLKKDGTPDMRYAVNKAQRGSDDETPAESFRPSAKDGTPDMRYAVNKAQRGNDDESSAQVPHLSGAGPLKKDGTPDMRYAMNKAQRGSDHEIPAESFRPSAVGPLKKDGTPDMRYAVNKAQRGSEGATLSSVSCASG